jgi:hypothetical protein
VSAWDGPVGVTVSRSGWCTRTLSDVELPAHSELGTIVLLPARGVVAEVIDERGQPLRDPEIQVTAPGLDPVRGSSLGPGKVSLQDVTRTGAPLRIDYAGRSYERELPAGVASARFVLPVHGTLELCVPANVPTGDEGSLRYRVVSLEDDFDARFRVPEGRTTGPRPLLPGRYRITLERSVWDGERAHVEVLGGPWEHAVRPGQHARLRPGEDGEGDHP